MARVVLNQAIIRATSIREAFELVNQVMYEVSFAAHAKLLSGPYTTSTLAASIKRDGPHIEAARITGSVGSDLPYAASVHDGAKVHWIFPKGAEGVIRFGSRKRPQLHFFWRKRGKFVFLPHIPGSPTKIGKSHPGQAGKHYLTEPLRRSARIHGFRVVTYDL